MEQYVVECGKITDQVIAKVNMQNVKGAVSFEWRLNNTMCISNLENDPLTLKAGLVIGGFGKVTWRRLEKDDDIVHPYELPVEFVDSNDLVLVGPKLVSLQEAIESRRSVNPNANVCYHDIVPDASTSAPGFFRLKIKSRVVAVLGQGGDDDGGVEEKDKGEKGGGKVKHSQASVATVVPKHIWPKLAPFAKVAWTVRWTPAGLMPVRPQLVLASEVRRSQTAGCNFLE